MGSSTRCLKSAKHLLNGRDTMVYHFSPGPKANLDHREAGVTGTTWVDEAERDRPLRGP